MGISFINKDDVFLEIYKQFNINNNDSKIDEKLFIPFIRKTASILCPTSESQIRKHVFDLLDISKKNIDYEDNLEIFEKSIEKLKLIGDLNEIVNFDSFDEKLKSTFLYIKQPCYLILQSKLILIGIDNNGTFPIPDTVKNIINFNNFDRIYEIDEKDKDHLQSELNQNSIKEISKGKWLKNPIKQKSNNIIEEYSAILNQKYYKVSYEIEDKSNFLVLNYDKPTNYFRGRFENLKKQTGNYILKRTKGFNQTGWSYAKIENGEIYSLLDFPTKKNLQSMNRFDEAMYLQSAIDHFNENTQEIKVKIKDTKAVIDFFHPVPRWVKRYLTSIGNEYYDSKSLFSYEIKNTKNVKKDIDIINFLGWYKAVYE
jgi:hypothetical protein